jgi:hypothetical protein
MLWFAVNSYSYVNPRGVCEHVSFVARFPFAAWRYWRLMRNA